jgi:hypothetical protein
VGGWLLLAVVAFALGRGNLLATGLLFAERGGVLLAVAPDRRRGTEGVTVPFPLTSRKTPFTGARPHMLLLFSRMLDVRGSRTHSPVRAPAVSRARTGGAVMCPDCACIMLPSVTPNGCEVSPI